MATTKTTNTNESPKDKKKSEKVPKDWDLMKEIKKDKDYKSNVVRRDKNARKLIEEQCQSGRKTQIFPGQLVSFSYHEPKTKEQLQYYDAEPVSIFFNIINTEQGKRYLSFNIHYYPPRIRWRVMERVFEIFKPLYLESFSKPLDSEMDFFNYRMLVKQLQKAKLDFGIREYIPELITNIHPIPLKYWPKAVFTEGRFKKETRAQILHYWKSKSEGITKPMKTRVGADGKKHKVK